MSTGLAGSRRVLVWWLRLLQREGVWWDQVPERSWLKV